MELDQKVMLIPLNFFKFFTLADETQSMVSYQQSILSEVPEIERRGTNSTLDVTPFPSSVGKPQESLVLQVYGISKPSQEFKERLSGIIQRKLDATTLDIMCNLYARNQQLKLTPEDVDFLQPDRKPTHTLHLSLPDWLEEGFQQPFFFYFLQSLSTLALHPMYSSSQDKQHHQFQAHQELQNAYVAESLSQEGYKDHLFLYVRPQTKGRGMALLCVTLADPTGRVLAPIPGLTLPMVLPDGGQSLQDKALECVVSEEVITGANYSIRIHVWEKGNIGLEEFMQKLSLCFKHTVLDYYLELCLLPCAIASPVTRWDDLGSDVQMLVGVAGGELGHYHGDHDDLTPVAGLYSPSYSRTQSPKKDLYLPTRTGQSIIADVPRKIVSVVSYKTSDSSRRNSESMSRRGSALELDSRRGSALGSDSRRGSALGSESSRKSSLAQSDRRRSSSEKGDVRPEDLWSHHKFPDEVIKEVEEYFSSSSDLRGSLDLSHSLGSVSCKQEVGGDDKSLWLQKEKQRRIDEAMESLIRNAELGKCGLLKESFSTAVPAHLRVAHTHTAPSVKFATIPLMGNYSTRIFTSQVLSFLELSCQGLSTDVFQLTPSGYLHVLLEKDWTRVRRKVLDRLYATQFILLSRNLVQWEECCHGNGMKWPHPTSCSSQVSQAPHAQLFHPLDSRKLSSSSSASLCGGPPLQTIAEARQVFVPRKSLIYIQVSQQKVRS